MPYNIQGSGLYHDQNIAMVDDSNRLSVALTGSTNTYSQSDSIFEIYRFLAGSPFTTRVLSGLSNGFMVENLGSNVIYFNFNDSVNPAAGSTLRMGAGAVLSLDLRIGSIMVQSSGTSSSEV